MNECDEIREQLSAWLDGELPEAEARAVAAHLDACPACKEETEALRAVAESVRNLPRLAAPPSLLARIHSGVGEATPAGSAAVSPAPAPAPWVPSRRGFWGVAGLSAAALLVVALLVGLFMKGESPQLGKTVAHKAATPTVQTAEAPVRGQAPASNVGDLAPAPAMPSVTFGPPDLSDIQLRTQGGLAAKETGRDYKLSFGDVKRDGLAPGELRRGLGETKAEPIPPAELPDAPGPSPSAVAPERSPDAAGKAKTGDLTSFAYKQPPAPGPIAPETPRQPAQTLAPPPPHESHTDALTSEMEKLRTTALATGVAGEDVAVRPEKQAGAAREGVATGARDPSAHVETAPAAPAKPAESAAPAAAEGEPTRMKTEAAPAEAVVGGGPTTPFGGVETPPVTSPGVQTQPREAAKDFVQGKGAPEGGVKGTAARGPTGAPLADADKLALSSPPVFTLRTAAPDEAVRVLEAYVANARGEWSEAPDATRAYAPGRRAEAAQAHREDAPAAREGVNLGRVTGAVTERKLEEGRRKPAAPVARRLLLRVPAAQRAGLLLSLAQFPQVTLEQESRSREDQLRTSEKPDGRQVAAEFELAKRKQQVAAADKPAATAEAAGQAEPAKRPSKKLAEESGWFAVEVDIEVLPPVPAAGKQ